MNLVGFSGVMSSVVRKVVMSVETKGVTIYSTVMVANANLAYNAILEGPWLHKMKVIPSTYHHMVKFPSSG